MSPDTLRLPLLCSLGCSILALGGSPARAEPGGGAADVAQLLDRASGVAGGLTSDQLAAAARATSPQLAARAADRAAAAADADQARAAYLPHLALTARAVRLSDITPAPVGDVVVAPGSPQGLLAPGARLASEPIRFPVLLDQTALDVQLVVPISDDVLRVARGVAAAEHHADAARLVEQAQQRTVSADARLLYYTWARARLSALVAADAVHQAELHLADVERRAAADRASRADVLAVQAQRAAAEQARVRAGDLARVAEAEVRIALHGAAPAGALEIGESLSRDLPLADPGSDDALIAEAIAHRPEPRAAGADIAALTEQARAAAAAALPRLDLIGQLNAADPNPRYVPAEDAFHLTWSVGAQLTWSIGDVPGQLAQARALRARAASAAAQRAALGDALRAEVVEAAAAMRDAASARITTAQQLASAEEAYRVRSALFREGAATSTELSDAETARTRAQLDAIAARIDARIAAVRLAYATGRDGAEPR